MAKSRNPNHQGGDSPEEIHQTADADILATDEQVDDQPAVSTVTEADSSQSAEPTASPSKKKGSNAVWYGVAGVLVAAAVAGVYYSNQSEVKGLTPGTVNQTTPDASSIQEVPADPQGLERSDPPLSADEVPEPSASESFNTEMGEEESKANFMGAQATAAAPAEATESDAATAENSADDVASAADVVAHQSGDQPSTELAETTQDASVATADKQAAADESTAVVPGEQGPVVSPEVGIGAFEQEELAKGEMDTQDMTATDEPNATQTSAAEAQAQVNAAEAETEDTASTAEDASTTNSLTEPASEPAATESSTEAPADTLPPPASDEASSRPAAEHATSDSDKAAAEPMADSGNDKAATEQMADPTVLAQLEREYELLNVRQQQEIHRLQEELAGMQQHLQVQNTSAENLLLNDVSRLMQSAENELRFNGNVPNAVSILTVAQRLAAESKNKMLEGLVGAIGADIVALKSNESATVDDMFKQVQQVASLIDAAPLNTPDYASQSQLMLPTAKASEAAAVEAADETSETTALDADAKWYDRAWSQTKSYASKAYGAVASDLGDLVRVEKLSEPDSGLLSVEQAGILRNNLKMQLSFAQQGLMSRQQGVWQTSLMTVEQALDQYFRADAAETQQAKMLLTELKKASVQPSMPDISHSRRALSETYEQLRVQRSFQE